MPVILRIVSHCVLKAVRIGFYLNFVYLSTWLVQYTGLSRPVALLLNAAMLAMQLVTLPLAGALSDRIGRKAQMLLATLGFALMSWPLYSLISHGSIWAIMAGQLGFVLLQSGISSALPAYTVEALPKHVRCTALSFGTNLAQAIFGGTVPLVAVALISATGYNLAPSLYLAAAGVVSFLVILTSNVRPENKESLG